MISKDYLGCICYFAWQLTMGYWSLVFKRVTELTATSEMMYFTEHHQFEITDIVHCKVWDHCNTAMQVVLYCNMALQKGSTL